MAKADEAPSTHELRVTQLTVGPVGSSLFNSGSTSITIFDEGGGEFVEVLQPVEHGIRIEGAEWPELKEAIDRMINLCR